MKMYFRLYRLSATSLFALLACIGIGLNASPVAAQRALAPQPQAADDTPEPEPTEGVFVRDSPAAWDSFQNGVRMERLKEWAKAADFYQEVVEKYRDRVVPAGQDADHHNTHYTSIVRLVQQQLSKWPAEGLTVYRGRYETPAQTLLDSAKPTDAFTLHRVFDRYFVTASGKAAGLRLIDIALERGEYRTAAAVGQHLLELHPDLGSDAAGIMFRTALAYHLAGDEKAASQYAARLSKEHPADHGLLRGQDVVLADALGAELKAAPATATDSPDSAGADSWPVPWGDSSRSRISSAAGRPGVKLFSIPLSKPVFSSLPAGQKATFEQTYNLWTENGATLGIMPVTDRGQLFFQDGQRLFGVSVESGLPLPGWAQTYPGTGQFVLPNVWGSPRTHQLTTTLTAREVLAVMGQPDRQGMLQGVASQSETRLVCLDRESGKENWTALLSQLPDEASSLRELQMTGTPLVVGDSVMIIGRAGKQVQFEDTYVLSFDLKTGKYRWSCYVASANMAGFAGMPAMYDENTSHLSYSDGLVFVQTNLGAIGAIDPYGATLVWVDIYPSRSGAMEANPFVPQNMANTQNMSGRLPWTHNPVIVSGGRIFTLPRDGKKLLIYDAVSGTKLKSVPIADLRECETLLGVVGEQVIMCGTKEVIAFNWTKYEPTRFTEDDLDWIETLPNPIRGRGFIAGKTVFIPARDRLWWLDLSTHKIVSAYPRHPRTWEDGEGPGNVLVTSDHVIIAGANSVDGYTDLSIAQAKLEKEVASAPSDPQPLIRFAELMFVAKDPDAALAKLDAAVKLMGGSAMPPGALRDEVFADAVGFGERLSAQGPDLAGKAAPFLDRAAAAASSPMQQVHYRLSRARLEEKSRDPAGAVKLYQEILTDPKLRVVALGADAGAIPSPAGVVAENAIAAITKSDPSVYAPFEQLALKALEDAQRSTSDQASKLLEVARTYPNSSIAGQASLEAADAYEAAGNPQLAVQVARQLYFRGADSPMRARILETMARNYLEMSDRRDVVPAAAARLAQGAALPGDPFLEKPLRLPDHRVLQHVHFSEALDAVRKYGGDRALRTLPDFGLPIPQRAPAESGHRKFPRPFLPPSPKSVIDGVKSLVVPLRDSARNDRLVAWSTAMKLEIFAVGTDQPPTIAEMPEGAEPKKCAWVGSNLLVWGGPCLLLFNETGGAPTWSVDLRSLGSIEVARGGPAPAMVRPPPNVVFFGNGRRVLIRGPGRMIIGGNGGMQIIPPAPAAVRPAGGPEEVVDVLPVADRVLVSTSAGRLVCADLQEGKIAWQTRLSERAIDRFVANDDFTVARVADETTVRLVAIDTFSGELRGSKSFSTEGQSTPVNMALSADGTLVYTLPDRLCLKNLYTPWPDVSDREVAGPGDAPAFRSSDGAASQPDQLLISEGRILALADTGGQKVVRVHSLETGNPLPLHYSSPNGEQEVDRVLNAGASWNVSLRVVGPHLYVFGPQGAASYNLDRPAETWGASMGDLQLNVREAFVGQKFVVMVSDEAPPAQDAAVGAPPAGPPGPQPPAGPQGPAAAPVAAAAVPTTVSLRAFGRYSVSTNEAVETGRLDYNVPITDEAGIVGPWQALDRGFCYVTGDQKLHLLLGARDPAEK